MSKREKILAAIIGALLVAGIGYAGVRKLLVEKGRGYDRDHSRLKKDLAKLKQENEKVESAARSIKGWARLTYDTDELRASAKIGASLVALVERAGLSPEKLSLQPVRGARVRGAYKEIGRTIRVRGGLKNVVDFLYLLEQESHLHRLDNISITPVPKTKEIDLQVRYITMIVDTKQALETDKLPTTAPTDLGSDQRKLFDTIASRDLFRPYIQRREAPAPPTPVARVRRTRTPAVTPTPRPAPPSPGRFRVVGLPEWRGKHDVLVSDTSTGQLRAYHPGDTLGGGVIVMVDYRPLPLLKNPQMLSPSRVILKMDPDYWAVELGQNLTQKRALRREQLPETIRSLPKPVPGDKVKKNAPAER